MKNTKSLLVALGFLPCLVWGITLSTTIILKQYISWPAYLSDYQIYRVLYLLRSLVFLPLLLAIYKQFLPHFDQARQKLYVRCSLLAIVCLMGGFFVETKCWNYMLNGCLVSPLLEEIIARFVLYEAKTKGFKIYVVVAMLFSFSFGATHFFYESSALLDKAAILPKFTGHFVFGLILSGIF